MGTRYLVVATEDELILPAAREQIDGRRVIVTGVGGTNVIRALRDIPKDADILNVGYCGSANFAVGTALTIGRARLYHPNVEFAEQTFILGSGAGLCLTAGDFVNEADIPTDAVVDMELAYICALGFTNLKSIKIVSDHFDYDQYEKTIKDK